MGQAIMAVLNLLGNRQGQGQDPQAQKTQMPMQPNTDFTATNYGDYIRQMLGR